MGNDSIGETFKEILRNKEIPLLNTEYLNDDLFNEICNILKCLKYLDDKSLLEIVNIDNIIVF